MVLKRRDSNKFRSTQECNLCSNIIAYILLFIEDLKRKKERQRRRCESVPGDSGQNEENEQFAPQPSLWSIYNPPNDLAYEIFFSFVNKQLQRDKNLVANKATQVTAVPRSAVRNKPTTSRNQVESDAHVQNDDLITFCKEDSAPEHPTKQILNGKAQLHEPAKASKSLGAIPKDKKAVHVSRSRKRTAPLKERKTRESRKERENEHALIFANGLQNYKIVSEVLVHSTPIVSNRSKSVPLSLIDYEKIADFVRNCPYKDDLVLSTPVASGNRLKKEILIEDEFIDYVVMYSGTDSHPTPPSPAPWDPKFDF